MSVSSPSSSPPHLIGRGKEYIPYPLALFDVHFNLTSYVCIWHLYFLSIYPPLPLIDLEHLNRHYSLEFDGLAYACNGARLA
jgi:hypothetical protein